MKIYKLSSDPDNYYPIKFCNDEYLDKIKLFAGDNSIKSVWNSIPVEYVINDGDNKSWPDSPYLSPGVPVINKKAFEVLRDILGEKTEVLNLECKGHELYALNVINMIDGLDMEESEFKRYSSGKIMRCLKYVFKPENVKSEDIFKVKEFPNGLIFVSERFKMKAIESGLKGFEFVEVWNSQE